MIYFCCQSQRECPPVAPQHLVFTFFPSDIASLGYCLPSLCFDKSVWNMCTCLRTILNVCVCVCLAITAYQHSPVFDYQMLHAPSNGTMPQGLAQSSGRRSVFCWDLSSLSCSDRTRGRTPPGGQQRPGSRSNPQSTCPSNVVSLRRCTVTSQPRTPTPLMALTLCVCFSKKKMEVLGFR